MKRVGIVICNYNKAEMVVECIKCILENTYKNFDIFVVDNASGDNSVELIKATYSTTSPTHQITLIENKENLGGTGGFNTGLRLAYEKGYDYLMCVDNDAYLDENAIGVLVDFLDQHQECGMAASKVYHMEEPGRIQQYGQDIDFAGFSTIVPELNVWDDGSLAPFKYVDAVAACSLMVRRSTIDKIGFMSEEFFLYWDDTDWCTRCWLSGLKVASVGSSYALHLMGAKKENVNTFPTYYAWRNWIRFFIKYTNRDDYERMCKSFLSSIFAVYYAGYHKKEFNLSKTVMLAYDDAIHGITGKAPENRIFPVDTNSEPFERVFSSYRKLYVEEGDYPSLAQKIKELALSFNPTIEFIDKPNPLVKTIKLCESIFLVKDMSLDAIYIDLDLCIFSNKDEAMNVINYDFAQSLFVESQLPVFLQKINELDINAYT